MKITPVQLAKRIEKWGQALSSLGVAHWEIAQVMVGDADYDDSTESKASVHMQTMYDECHFYVNKQELERMDERELDTTIIHEWLHVAMRDHDRLLYSVENVMTPAAFDVFQMHVKHEREGLVQRLATVLYEFHAGIQPRFAPPK